jgi:predicted nucleic acid-binding protein
MYRVAEVREVLAAVRAACTTVPLTDDTHDTGLRIAGKFRLPVYDATIVASALLAGCRTLQSEDVQHGQKFEGQLEVLNPFR